MLGVLLGAACMFTSCLGSDSDSDVSSSDAAITGLTLGTLNRYVHNVAEGTGNDTIVKTTLAGSGYPMIIDQMALRIYNEKLLPVGTDLKHVTVSSVSAKNGGSVYIRSVQGDTLKWLQSTDSIDFSVPRKLCVVSSNGLYSRDYTVDLGISQSDGVQFEWRKVDEEEFELAGKTLVALDDTVALVDNGTVVSNETAYRVRNGWLERSLNLAEWERQVASTDIRLLVGASSRELFALTNDGRLKHLVLSTLTWEDELLDSDASLLPEAGTTNAVYMNYAPSNQADYVLLTGYRNDCDDMLVWRKISEYEGDDVSGQWVYMPTDGNNIYTLPKQEEFSMTAYNGIVLALDCRMLVLESRDQGITWKTSSQYSLPANVGGTTGRIAADNSGRLWVVTDNGEVWQGNKR